MQTIIQHVMRGYGPPSTAPAEIGVHYIDVVSGDMYIARGKSSVADWGAPLAAAMVDGEEGKTFGWQDGQTWLALALGVPVSDVDSSDVGALKDASDYADSIVSSGDYAIGSNVVLADVTTLNDLKDYIDAQLALVVSVPSGGDVGNVMTKLSDADRDAYWYDVQAGEVLPTDVVVEISAISGYADGEVASKVVVPVGGTDGQLLNGDEQWVDPAAVLNAPQFINIVGGSTIAPMVEIQCTPYDHVFSGVERLHRAFEVNGVLHEVDSDSISLDLAPGTDYTIKVRDVAIVGISEWTEIDFKTRDVYNEAVLSTNAIGGSASDPLVLNVEFSTVGGVDNHVATDWVLKNSGVVVWSSLNDSENLTEIEVPAGILVDSNSYDVEVRAVGQVYGTSAWVVELLVVSAGFNGLVVPHSTDPFVTIYQQDQGTFTKLANPAELPASTGNGCSFSPDGVYLAVAHFTSPYITIYKRSGDVFTKLANPAVLPTGNGFGCSFSPDGVYLAVAHASSPRITIYKRSGDVFTKLANPAGLPTGTGYGCSFSPDGVYLAVAHNSSPFIAIYKRSGDVFTKLANPAGLPTGTGYGCSFSPDGVYLAVAHLSSPRITIYKRSGDVFTKLANPAVMPANTGRGCSFSPDGVYLAVTHVISPFITIYKRSGDVFTKLANPAVLPTGDGQGCSFSPDGVYLAVAHLNSPYITIYKRSGDVFTKLANPAVLPTGSGQYSVAWYYQTLPVIGPRATQ